MLEMTILGTSSGIPSIDRNHTSIWFRYDGECWLWDCGEGTQRQMLKAKLNFMRIKRIFITHWHADHWAGMIGLIQTLNLEDRKQPLYIYGPEAERFVSDILDLDYWGPRFRVIPKPVPIEGKEITMLVKTMDFEISSIPVEHSVPTVAYCFKEKDRWKVDIKKAEKLYGLKQGPLIGKLKRKRSIALKGKKINLSDIAKLRPGVKVVYSGDTLPCKNIVKLAADADLLIHDATFVEEKEEKMHSGAKEAAQIAKKARVKKLILTHFSRRYQDVTELEKEAKAIFPNSLAAEDFMKIKL